MYPAGHPAAADPDGPLFPKLPVSAYKILYPGLLTVVTILAEIAYELDAGIANGKNTDITFSF